MVMINPPVNWKLHFWWAVALGCVILLALVTFWVGGKGNEIVSHISFAGAVASIVLAIVAIIYTFVQSIYSQQNTGEMRRLIWEASRIMTDKAGVLAEKADSMDQRSLLMIRMLQTVPQHATGRPALPGHTFRMNTSDCSLIGLLLLYYLAMCYEHRREASKDDLTKAVFGEILSSYYKFLDPFFDGVLDGLSCFFEPGTIKSKEGTAKFKSLPEGFVQYVSDEVHKRIEDDNCDPVAKARFAKAIKRVDFMMSGGDITFKGLST